MVDYGLYYLERERSQGGRRARIGMLTEQCLVYTCSSSMLTCHITKNGNPRQGCPLFSSPPRLPQNETSAEIIVQQRQSKQQTTHYVAGVMAGPVRRVETNMKHSTTSGYRQSYAIHFGWGRPVIQLNSVS